jgi:hypothetical protein
MPPVTNIPIPTLCEIYIVLATVVPPIMPLDNVGARSLLEALTLASVFSGSDSLWSCSSVRPTWIFPSKMAIVAGVTDEERRILSRDWAVVKLVGYGIPRYKC